MVSKYSPVKGNCVPWRNEARAGKMHNYPGTYCSIRKEERSKKHWEQSK